MNMDEIFAEFQKVKADFYENYGIVNDTCFRLDELQQMGCKEFSLRTKRNMPPKLYKYCSYNGYYLQTLENNTVFFAKPYEF